jgi:hypothetical protein
MRGERLEDGITPATQKRNQPMNSKLDARVKAMELERSDVARDAQREIDAKHFTDKILARANRFEDSDGGMQAAERQARFSGADHLAWALRFGSKDEVEAALEVARGYASRAS